MWVWHLKTLRGGCLHLRNTDKETKSYHLTVAHWTESEMGPKSPKNFKLMCVFAKKRGTRKLAGNEQTREEPGQSVSG